MTVDEQTIDFWKALKAVPLGRVVLLSVVGLSLHVSYTILVVGQYRLRTDV